MHRIPHQRVVVADPWFSRPAAVAADRSRPQAVVLRLAAIQSQAGRRAALRQQVVESQWGAACLLQAEILTALREVQVLALLLMERLEVLAAVCRVRER